MIGVRRCTHPISDESVTHHRHRATGIGAFVTNRVAFGDVVPHHDVARFALAHIDSRVGHAGCVGVFDQTVLAVEGVDPVQPVVVGRQVIHVKPVEGWEFRGVQRAVTGATAGQRAGRVRHPGDQHSVEDSVADGQILDGDAAGSDGDAVRPENPAIDDHGVAVGAAQRDAGGVDGDRLGVETGADQHQVTAVSEPDTGADGGCVRRHGDDPRPSGCPGSRVYRAGAGTRRQAGPHSQ